MSRLATTGSCAIDISDWAAGARFVALALTTWPLSAAAPAAAFDWQLVADRPPGLCPADVWPVSARSLELSQTPLPPVDVPPAATRVGHIGMVRGWRPRLAVATNEHTSAVSVAAAARYGAALERVRTETLAPGDSRVIARLDDNDPATGLELYASATAAGAHLTLDYA